MRAAVIYEHGDLDNIAVEADYPQPGAKPGWVILRVRACSVNYHDIFTRRGMPGIKIPLPIVVGSDIAGEVAECGAGVEGWAVGDRVLVDPMPTEGTDGLFIGEKFDGGRAEYCAAHSSQLMRLDDAVSFDEAASLPLAYATAHRMMVTKGRISGGEIVLILGASGGVGTASVLLSKLAGAKVIACAGSDEKMARLARIGADEVVNYRANDMREAVWDLVGKPSAYGSGGGVDVVVNCTGGGTLRDSMRCLKPGGRLLTCGATAGFEDTLDFRFLWTYEHVIQGSNGWRRADIEALLDMIKDGRMKPVIDRVVPLDETREAERLLEEREVFGKVIIAP